MKIINSLNKNIKNEFQNDSSINEVMAIEEGFWDDDFISQNLDNRAKMSKSVQNCVTSFMDNP